VPENTQNTEQKGEQDESNRKPQITFRASEEKKGRWEEYIEQSGMYSSLSDLIRKAVEKEISDETEQVDLDTEELETTIETNFEQVNQALNVVKTDVAWLRSQEEHDIEAFAHRLFSVLKPIPTDDDEEERSAKAVTAGMDPQQKEDLAEKLNSNVPRVEEALEYLKENHMPVMKYEIDGETHYFREQGQ
jgi:Arc/MetJ-type ribon-helix-helix transcriptional regulator